MEILPVIMSLLNAQKEIEAHLLVQRRLQIDAEAELFTSVIREP